MKKKVLITGINGLLGSAIFNLFVKYTNFELFGVGRSQRSSLGLKVYFQGDICDLDFLKKISEYKYDFIIHCAAIVNLDTCESNYNLAEKTHIIASKNLAFFNPSSVYFYISTDSVFDGSNIRNTEEDIPKPLNNYALTKYLGGEEVRKIHKSSYELRVNLYGFNTPSGSSLFEWAYQELKDNKEIKGYDNVYFNPLYTRQIAEIIMEFINYLPPFGIYNLGSNGGLSKFDFVVRVADLFNLNRKLAYRFKAEFSQNGIKRPYNTILNTQKLKKIFPSLDLSLDSGLLMLKDDLEN